MSTYSGPQPQQKFEHTTSVGGGHTGDDTTEQLNPNFFNAVKQESHNPKLGAVTAGSSSKISSSTGGGHVKPGHE